MKMGTCKPLSITRKQDINKMCKELISARQALKVENHALELNDIQLLRLVLLGCLYSSLSGAKSSRECTDFNSLSDDTDSLLGDRFSETYTGIARNDLLNIRCSSVIKHLNIMTDIPLWKDLLPYALEILEYSEQELENAAYDRRDGVITEKKKQHGVYYTPYDVVRYMVNGCLDRLSDQKMALLNCRYIDYSCGSGVFLLKLLECVIERNPTMNYDDFCSFVEQSIYGVDVSPYAVECCQYILIQRVVDYCNKFKTDFLALLSNLRKNIIVADATDMDTYHAIHSDFPRSFECIIGNPPYVGISTGTQHRAKSNLFIPFVYNLQKYSCEKSVCSLVLPLSFSYNNHPGFREMRRSIENDNAEWFIEHYDRSPDSLFGDDVKARACIVFRIDNNRHIIHTTGLMRWTSHSREMLLTASKLYGEITNFSIEEYIPKLSCKCESTAYNKILDQRVPLLDLVKPQTSFDQNCIAIKGTAYNWICAYDHLPPAFNSDGNTYVSKDLKIFSCKSTADKYFSLACLNSKLAFWLWTVVGDGFHVTNRLLSVFSPGNDSVAYDTLVTLGQDFSEKIKKYPIISINSGKTIISYDHKQLMGIIEQIDTLLIEALNIDKSFLTYLNQWYFDFVDCGRQSVDEFQE